MAEDREELKTALKALIIEECDKDELTPEDIADDEALIGGAFELDSLDALQICMAVQNQYGVRIETGPQARKALRSVNALTDTIIKERGA